MDLKGECYASSGCAFVDPKTGECRRLVRLANSSGMEQVKHLFRTFQIGDILMGRTTEEINRTASLAVFAGDQREPYFRCPVANDSAQQLDCDGYWGLDGKPGPRTSVITTPKVQENIKLLLYANKISNRV